MLFASQIKLRDTGRGDEGLSKGAKQKEKEESNKYGLISLPITLPQQKRNQGMHT